MRAKTRCTGKSRKALKPSLFGPNITFADV